MTPGPVVAVLAAALALAGCSSPEQKLVERRRDLRATLDELYGDYRGSAPAKGDEAGSGGGAEGLVGRMLAEVDRTHFEQYCLAIGRGERPFSVSGRLDAFIQESGNGRKCRRAADLALEIESLERELGGR